MTFGLGLGAAAVAAVGFGSNFVPVKKYDMGDGMMFQMIMALGIWLVGLVYGIIQSFEDGNNDTLYFHPFALLGGVIWALGNVTTVAIIKTIGMALGLAVWSSTAIVIGWITGKFGLLGTPKDTGVNTPWLNYAGVGIILLCLIAFFQVSPSNAKEDEEPHLPKNEGFVFNPAVGHLESPAIVEKRFEFVNQTTDLLARREMEIEIEHVQSWIDNLNKRTQTLIGLILAIFSGICYGLVFCPIQYLISEHKNHQLYPKKLEMYQFTHFSGILLCATILFILYSIYTKNNPQVSHDTILPSLISGIVWGIAQIGFFIAQDPQNLGTDVSFPIVCAAPQIIASLWGVFVFREVTGGKSLCKLAFAITLGLTGITCIAMSKLLK